MINGRNKVKNKQRKHSRVGGIDKYPAIDKFIPEAEMAADSKFFDKSAPKYIEDWTALFCEKMNSILIKKGLRI
jgi:hypothetical protein